MRADGIDLPSHGADQLFDGVARATTKATSAETGVTLGVLHYCFSSRVEMLEEAAKRLTDRKAAEAREAFASGTDLHASIEQNLRTFWQGAETAPGEEQVGFELTQYALRNEEFEQVARRQYEHYLEVYNELLGSAARSAGVRFTAPVPVLARFINAMLDAWGRSLTPCCCTPTARSPSSRIAEGRGSGTAAYEAGRISPKSPS